MIEGIALKEAGSAVAATNDPFIHRLESEAYARHYLVVGAFVAGAGGANLRTRNRQGRNMACILHRAIRKNVGSLVVLLVPRLVILIAQPEIESELAGYFHIVLKVACQPPLPVTHIADGVS